MIGMMMQHCMSRAAARMTQALDMCMPAHGEIVVGGRDDRKGRRLAPHAGLVQRLRTECRMQQIPLGALARLQAKPAGLKQRVAK